MPKMQLRVRSQRYNKLSQMIDYITANNGIQLQELHTYFMEKWYCSSNVITNALKKLGREQVIKTENNRLYVKDEWLLKQRKS